MKVEDFKIGQKFLYGTCTYVKIKPFYVKMGYYSNFIVEVVLLPFDTNKMGYYTSTQFTNEKDIKLLK